MPLGGHAGEGYFLALGLIVAALRVRQSFRAQTTKRRAAVKLEDKAALLGLVDRIDSFVLDCDGVLWRGDTVLEGVKETLAMLRRENKSIIFVTNQSKSRRMVKQKFDRLGLEVNCLVQLIST